MQTFIVERDIRGSMSHNGHVTVLRRFRIGHLAIGIAIAVIIVPASFAQDPRVPNHGKPTAIGIEAEGQQISDGLRLEAREHGGVFIAVPIGRVSVDPEFVDGEPTYVRRTTAKEGMAIVEVSATPFIPILPGVGALIGRPEEQPASW